MLYMLEKLEFTISALTEDWRAKGFHDLLDGDR